jgi:hypothetical protein
MPSPCPSSLARGDLLEDFIGGAACQFATESKLAKRFKEVLIDNLSLLMPFSQRAALIKNL